MTKAKATKAEKQTSDAAVQALTPPTCLTCGAPAGSNPDCTGCAWVERARDYLQRQATKAEFHVAAFTEWARLYRDEPHAFAEIWEGLRTGELAPSTYGEKAAAFFAVLIGLTQGRPVAAADVTSTPDAALTVGVENGRLVIAIGIDNLAHAFTHGPVGDRLAFVEALDDFDRSRVAVTDAAEFAKEVSAAMLDEAEDGSSPLTRFIDAMFDAALDDGATSVLIPHLGLDDGQDEKPSDAPTV